MYKKNTATMILAVVLILVVAFAAFAQTQQNQGQTNAAGRAGMAPNQFRGGFAFLQRILLPPNMREMAQMSVALSLTDDQKAKIKELAKTFAAAVKQIAPERGPAVKAVLQGLQQPTPNKSDLVANGAKVGQADQAILSAELDFWIGLKALMSTPAQQTQVQTFIMQKAEHEMGGGQGRTAGPTKTKGQKPAGQAPAGGGAVNNW